MQNTIALLMLMLGLMTTGCSAIRDTTAPPQTVKRLAALDYPENAPHGPDLDVLLVRSGGQVRIVNRTPNTYGGMQLWLNRQYVRDSGTIQIGTGNLRLLTDFINLYEEPYPVGTFLNPDQTAPLVLAELYNPQQNVRYRLLVRPGNETTIQPFEELNN
ncbi:MAG: hypothetical protein AAGI37_13835 [Planctomycetota bacterium]